MTSDLADDQHIKAALEELNRLIAERVKREQRRDQLTGLPNGLALDEALATHIERGRDVWAAFIEVDKFKSINDRFGYQRADELLKELSKLLAEVSASFPGTVQVFRQHGDEFFIVGAHDGPDAHRPDALDALLALTLQKVRKLSVPVVVGAPDSPPVALECTVSIGWLVLNDVASPQTARSILTCLERAVDEAKRTRDCAVRYTSELARRRVASLRADCAECRSKFSVDVPIHQNRDAEPLRCPNCAAEVPRPPSGPTAPPVAGPPVEV